MGAVYIDDIVSDYVQLPVTSLVSKAKLEIQFQEKIIYKHMGPQISTVISMLKVVFKCA